MADSLEILNAIRSVAGDEYQARIPEAVRTNIAQVGNTILSYAPSANAFFTGLLNRIGKVVIDRMDGMEDIYDVFENGKLEFGDTIQKIFVDIPKAKAFDGTATTAMLNQEKGVIHVEYTKVDRKLFYKTTISVAQIKEAFTTVAKLDEFVRALVEAMSTALGYDKYIMLTETLAKHCEYVVNAEACAKADSDNDDKFRKLVVPATVAVYNSTTKEIEWETTGAKVFLKLLRVASRSLKFPHALSYGDPDLTGEELDNGGTISVVRTPVNKQVCALEVSTMATIDVDALAVLFNIDKAEPKTRMIELEDGALGDITHDGTASQLDYSYHLAGFICDRDVVERGTSFEDRDSFKNPEAQYVNMWNHYWGYMAVSKFKDFVPILFTYKPAQAQEGN